jgi:outer membrane protein assembly factor BamB
MRLSLYLALGGVVLSCLLQPARGADREQFERNWPHWRGPDQNGLVLHGNPPLSWAEDKNVQWKVAIPGLGHATPIIWEDKIFILTAASAEPDTKKLAFSVLCLDRRTGQTLWTRVAREDVPHQEIQPTNSHASGSPVTDGELLIVPFGSFGLYAYDLGGNLLWEKDLGKVQVTWGEGSSAALAGEAVIVIQDNEGASFIYAFHKRTGKELWKKPRDEKSSWTTPYVLTRGGRTQVIVNGAKAVRSYDPATGEVLWQCSGLGVNVTPMVLVDRDTVYAMSGQRTSPMAMAITLGPTGDLTETSAVKWTLNRGTPYASSPLLYDGLLYFVQHVTPILTCLDAATGKPHYAQHRLDGLTTVYASPIGVNNRVYFTGLDGTTLVLEKSPRLNVLATNKLDDSFAASPVVVGDDLFLRGRKHLYCLSEK